MQCSGQGLLGVHCCGDCKEDLPEHQDKQASQDIHIILRCWLAPDTAAPNDICTAAQTASQSSCPTCQDCNDVYPENSASKSETPQIDRSYRLLDSIEL